MTIEKPSLDEMIDEAAKLPPEPEAWDPIFKAFPGLSVERLEQKFREKAEAAFVEADELRRYLRLRQQSHPVNE
ncbi:MAG: hypothetical protein WB611_00925 [Stellaceae bacterium]